MFKLLIDHANADKEMSGYTLCARMLEGDKTTLIEGAVKLVSEDGLSVLVLTRDLLNGQKNLQERTRASFKEK